MELFPTFCLFIYLFNFIINLCVSLSVQDDPEALPIDTLKVEQWMEENFESKEQPFGVDFQGQQRATFLMRKPLGPRTVAAMATLGDDGVAVCQVSRKRKVTTLILNEELENVKTIPFSYSSNMVHVQKSNGDKLLVCTYSGSGFKEYNTLIGWHLSTLSTTPSVVFHEPVVDGRRWTNLCKIGDSRIACWHSGKVKKGECVSVYILDANLNRLMSETSESYQCIDIFTVSPEVKQVHDMCYIADSCHGPLLVLCCPYQQIVMAYSYPSGNLCWSLDKKFAKSLFFGSFQPYSICSGGGGTLFIASPTQHRVFMISFLFDEWNGSRVAIEWLQNEHHKRIQLHAPRTVMFNNDILYVIHKSMRSANEFEISKFKLKKYSYYSCGVILKI